MFTLNTMSNTKEKQISVRIPAELDEWLQSKAVEGNGKADIVRSIIEKAREVEREEALFQVFEAAGKEWNEEDRAESESRLSAWSGHQQADPYEEED